MFARVYTFMTVCNIEMPNCFPLDENNLSSILKYMLCLTSAVSYATLQRREFE